MNDKLDEMCNLDVKYLDRGKDNTFYDEKKIISKGMTTKLDKRNRIRFSN